MKKRNGRTRLRMQRARLWKEAGGKCFYCGRITELPPSPSPPGWKLHALSATTEHLNNRFSPLRGKAPNGQRTRELACFECNTSLGSQHVMANIEEHKRRVELGKLRPKGMRRDQFFASAAPANIINEEKTK